MAKMFRSEMISKLIKRPKHSIKGGSENTPVKLEIVCRFRRSSEKEQTYHVHFNVNCTAQSVQMHDIPLTDGGEDFRAYSWIKKMGGIPTEESYGGYKGQDGFCHVQDANVTLVAPITGWVNVTSGDPNALKVALLKHGPISVAIDASHKTFSFYSHGVYYEPKW